MIPDHCTRLLYLLPKALLFTLLLGACSISFNRGAATDNDAGPDAGSGDGSVADAAAGDDGTVGDGQVPDDGCVPISDQELCAMQPQDCGSLNAFDNCGGTRTIPECGPCAPYHYCLGIECIAAVYEWIVGGWSACSVSCGGGVQTRSVVCRRDDGESVSDALCPSPKPATSRSCNTHSCCTPFCVSHDACGGDGCGGNCGSCSGDRFCWNGHCVWQHGNDGSATCHTICSWGSSSCVGTSSHSCGTSGVSGVQCYCW